MRQHRALRTPRRPGRVEDCNEALAQSCLTCWSTRSPAACPCSSLTFLKWSRSTMMARILASRFSRLRCCRSAWATSSGRLTVRKPTVPQSGERVGQALVAQSFGGFGESLVGGREFSGALLHQGFQNQVFAFTACRRQRTQGETREAARHIDDAAIGQQRQQRLCQEERTRDGWPSVRRTAPRSSRQLTRECRCPRC